MRKFIPFLVEEERKEVRVELGDSDCSLFFDATSSIAEVFVVGIRFLKDFRPVQRVLEFKLLASSLTGEDVAAALLVKTVSLHIQEQVIAFHSDCASVNALAMKVCCVLIIVLGSENCTQTIYLDRVFFTHPRQCWQQTGNSNSHRIHDGLESNA